jgi:hypothetical protein
MSLAQLQTYVTDRQLDLPQRAKDLFRGLRAALIEASNARAIRESPHDVFQRIKLLSEPPAQILDHLRERNLHEHAFCILGGEKNPSRDHAIRHFQRSDDAWFDFSIVVRERSERLDLLAYDFELRFPPGLGVPFLRFDLNLPEHANEERDIRCHLHPGSDDLLVPAPLMTPAELLTLFLEGAQLPVGRVRRAFTAFEAAWFERMYALVKQ